MIAKVQIEKIIEHLRPDIMQVLEEAIRRSDPKAKFHTDLLFRDFLTAVHRKCRDWEEVPDQCVELR